MCNVGENTLSIYSFILCFLQHISANLSLNTDVAHMEMIMINLQAAKQENFKFIHMHFFHEEVYLEDVRANPVSCANPVSRPK